MSEAPAESAPSSSTLSNTPQQGHHNAELAHSATIDYRSELIRKAIHLCSLSIPITYHFISQQLALQLLVPLTISFLVVDLARYYHPSISDWFYRWFGWLLRKHERNVNDKRLNGATYVLLASTICVFLFPKILVITALSILIISDSTSALVGRRYGKRRFLSKSLEGAIAFFISAVLVVLFTPKVQQLPLEYVIGMVGAAVGAVVESAPIHIDDNLSIPLSICCVMWLLYILLLPLVNFSNVV